MKAFVKGLGNAFLILLGILSAGMGLKGFLLSSRFIDGGVTGISMLLADLVGLRLSVWLLIVNLPFIAIGYRQIGRVFALKSALAIAGLSDVEGGLIKKPIFHQNARATGSGAV
jgi:uncharacterized membrane-anchored protein YitT (DUF2179 family)